MQTKEIETVIIEVLREAQILSGRALSGLTSESKPLGDLDGFDSLSAVEVTVAIEQKLECKFDRESIFVSDDGKRTLSVTQITDRIAKTLRSKESSK